MSCREGEYGAGRFKVYEWKIRENAWEFSLLDVCFDVCGVPAFNWGGFGIVCAESSSSS